MDISGEICKSGGRFKTIFGNKDPNKLNQKGKQIIITDLYYQA